MKPNSLLILLIIVVSLVSAFYINKWMQNIIQPRKSFGRLMIYLLTAFAFVFGYTFLLVLIITNLFPVTK